jgi:hypothetical protein
VPQSKTSVQNGPGETDGDFTLNYHIEQISRTTGGTGGPGGTAGIGGTTGGNVANQ